MKDFLFNTPMGQFTLILVGSFCLICLILLLSFFQEMIHDNKKNNILKALTINDFEWTLKTYLETIEINSHTGIYANTNSITKNIDGETYIDVYFFDYVHSKLYSNFLRLNLNKNPFSNNIVRTIKLSDWEKFKESVKDINRLQIEVYVLEAEYKGEIDKKVLENDYFYPRFYVQEYDIPNILIDNNIIRIAFKNNPNEFKELLLKVYKDSKLS